LRAYIIVDLGFGDSGKGLLTDFLVRRFEAGVVVRYNGGAQAGHNVVTPDGRSHTFSQFGSGAFIPHVRTYLSRDVVIHPTALLIEGDILARKDVKDPFSRLRLSDQALVITPFHQAANRIREMMRGTNRHGSCGVGVGEAVEDAQSDRDNCIRAGDLNRPTVLHRKLRAIREHKRGQISVLIQDPSPGPLLARELKVFEGDDVIEAWMASVARIRELGLVVSDSVLERWLRGTENVIFEGAQGVLLDAESGFHPFTTWSRCTAANALELIQEMAPAAPVFQIGVMRSYAVRHGPGPLPTETDSLTSVVAEHNTYNEWQGPVRYGWFDAVLARYALGITGRLDALAVTHLDVLPRLKVWKYCPGYKGCDGLYETSVDATESGGVLRSFRFTNVLPLDQRAQFTQALSVVTPELETCDAEDETVIRQIELLTGHPVGIISRGPGAENVQILNAFPL
jgi:adenylosuccinate synthase